MAAELSKKLGPFTGKQWAIGVAGGGFGYLGYRWWRNRSSASGAAVSTAPAGGTTIPGDTTTGTAGPAGVATLADWEQAALTFGTPSEMLNAITNWMSGNCIDQAGFNGLSSALSTLGLPPGMTSFMPLIVCPGGNPAGSSTPSGGGGTSSTGSGSSGNGTGTQGTPTPTVPVGNGGIVPGEAGAIGAAATAAAIAAASALGITVPNITGPGTYTLNGPNGPVDVIYKLIDVAPADFAGQSQVLTGPWVGSTEYGTPYDAYIALSPKTSVPGQLLASGLASLRPFPGATDNTGTLYGRPGSTSTTLGGLSPPGHEYNGMTPDPYGSGELVPNYAPWPYQTANGQPAKAPYTPPKSG